MKKQTVMLSVVSLILEVSSNNDDDAKKKAITTTKIMYNTLLNNPRLKEYWAALTEVGLLEHYITTNTLKTTEKGLRFLETFSELDQQSREEQNKKKEKNSDSEQKIQKRNRDNL